MDVSLGFFTRFGFDSVSGFRLGLSVRSIMKKILLYVVIMHEQDRQPSGPGFPSFTVYLHVFMHISVAWQLCGLGVVCGGAGLVGVAGKC